MLLNLYTKSIVKPSSKLASSKLKEHETFSTKDNGIITQKENMKKENFDRWSENMKK